MQCISRRACYNKNAFKLYREQDGEIKDGITIWTEYRCQNLVLEGSHVCVKCSIKDPTNKEQASYKFDHGVIGGDYTEKSKLYGSPYFLNQIKKGLKIRDTDEIRAKEAQIVTNMGRKAKTQEPLTISTPVSLIATPPTPPVTVPLREKEIKPRKPRVAKKASEVMNHPLPPSSEQPVQFVESNAVPIIIDTNNIIIVKLKKILCNRVEFYHDTSSGKVYAVSKNGVGPYKGRYNAESESIDSMYPDSDME
jgi:hypothetical protein